MANPPSVGKRKVRCPLFLPKKEFLRGSKDQREAARLEPGEFADKQPSSSCQISNVSPGTAVLSSGPGDILSSLNSVEPKATMQKPAQIASAPSARQSPANYVDARADAIQKLMQPEKKETPQDNPNERLLKQRIDPNGRDARACFERGQSFAENKKYVEALKEFREAVRLDPENAEAHIALAWLLATCPDDKLRDGKQAVEHAAKACSLPHLRPGYYMGALAAAHAECGDFKEAVRWQKKVVEYGLLLQDVEEAKQTLKLYEKGKPHRRVP